MPFKWKDDKKDHLVSTLSTFFKDQPTFSLQLKDFDVFAPKVIFVAVQADPVLNSLQKGLGRVMAEKLAIYNAGYRNLVFHPHVTIAFRDLKKQQFYQAWDYFRDHSFRAEFVVDQVTLLRHNGKIWQSEMEFDLIIT